MSLKLLIIKTNVQIHARFVQLKTLLIIKLRQILLLATSKTYNQTLRSPSKKYNRQIKIIMTGCKSGVKETVTLHMLAFALTTIIVGLVKRV